MLPAQQGFQAEQATAVQAQLGLVVQAQLIALQSQAQVVVEEQLVLGFGIQRFTEYLQLLFAVGLGLVQGQTGMFEQGRRIAAVQGRLGQADGAADADQLVVDEQRLAESFQQLPGLLLATVQAAVFQQQGELVAGKAGQRGLVGQAVAQAPGQAGEQFVAALVAQAVVDAFEVVDVHQQQAAIAWRLALEVLVETVDEERTVAQPGQGVGVGKLFHALLLELLVGDVLIDAEVMAELALRVKYLGDIQASPIGFMVLAPALEFTLPAVVAGQPAMAVEQSLGEVFHGGQLGDRTAQHLVGAVLGDLAEAGIDVV